MSILKTIFAIAFVLFLALLGGYAFMGGFTPVDVKRGSYGPAEIVYATHRGPYKDLGGAWTRFQTAWEAAGLTNCNSLSLYLDPPGTPPEELRSIIACRIDGLSDDEKEKWRAAFPQFVLPEAEALLSSFPFKNNASYAFAPMNVYPAISKKMEEENLEAVVGIEIYGDVNSIKNIDFVIPLGLETDDLTPLFEAF